MGAAAHLVYERWTDPVALAMLDERPTIEVEHLDIAGPPTTGWRMLSSAHGYQVAIRTVCPQVPGGEQWLAGPELIGRCPDLLAVATAGAGYDVVDVDACTKAGIAVCNNSGPGAEAVAEHALAMMLALVKRLAQADRAMRAGVVRDRTPFRGSELLGKTIGIVGLGAIGSRLAELVAPFDMEILAFDPYADEEVLSSVGAKAVPLDDLLDRSDIVQVTCPLTDETTGMFGREAYARMKRSAYFVTTARGEVHDEDALHDALVSGEIAGAGVDVFHAEPVPVEHPLLALDNVIASPHTAGITAEATYNLAVATAEQWIVIFDGGVPPRLVNPEVWPRYQDRFEAVFGRRPDAL